MAAAYQWRPAGGSISTGAGSAAGWTLFLFEGGASLAGCWERVFLTGGGASVVG